MHNPHADLITRATPLSERELFELLIAAFPERLNPIEEIGSWNEVMSFADSLVIEMNIEELCDLLGRIVLLTLPTKAAQLGRTVHALGSLKYAADGSFFITTAVERPALEVPCA